MSYTTPSVRGTGALAEAGPPDRVTVLTCIGCGAMSAPGECPGCCSDERRLELVPADQYPPFRLLP